MDVWIEKSFQIILKSLLIIDGIPYSVLPPDDISKEQEIKPVKLCFGFAELKNVKLDKNAIIIKDKAPSQNLVGLFKFKFFHVN